MNHAGMPPQFSSHTHVHEHRTPPRQRKTLVLCFDGTGNRFRGNANDSNIIKVFSMLDRADPNTFAYYQPGIGTYVDRSKLSKTGRLERLKSWWAKTKDQAIGTSFDVHIRGGYEFLVRFYSEGDDIYLFGFSRGAYTAKFLAQMVDSVGLLSAGNEELFRFAWKAFSQWQSRVDGTTDKERAKKLEMYNHLRSFRETFSRPVQRIKFLGLFDTVNSVPRFEAAFLQRKKFPYAARTSAEVIRHAVSIDERRAKFRVDLISSEEDSSKHPKASETHGVSEKNGSHCEALHTQAPKRSEAARSTQFKSRSTKASRLTAQPSLTSLNSTRLTQPLAGVPGGEQQQDIQEVWFPGDHGDLGGGWPLQSGQPANLTHAPLLWMLREARQAGLPCNEDALLEAHYIIDDPLASVHGEEAPLVQLEGEPMPGGEGGGDPYDAAYRARFNEIMTAASIESKKHDALLFGGGLPWPTVITWRIMEHLPFRRMDLRSDGTWHSIRWPLPRGETRDIPDTAVVHNSVVRRMQADPTYRPGNLIIGGGGRGVRVAPPAAGTGSWRVHRHEGHPVGEVFVKEKHALQGEKS